MHNNKINLMLFKRLLLVAFLLFPALISPAMAKDPVSNYQEIEWVSLIPEDDLKILMTPPDYIGQIEDGSSMDVLGDNAIPGADPEDEYQRALSSTRIIESYDGKKVRIPGFIVPLEVTDDQSVTEFFLVPYFGACLHMPPPPPNQMIHVKVEQGFPLDSLYDAFWLEGTLSAQINSNDLGTAAYALSMDTMTIYQE